MRGGVLYNDNSDHPSCLGKYKCKPLKTFYSDEQDVYYKGSAVVQMWDAPTGSWVWTLSPRWWCLWTLPEVALCCRTPRGWVSFLIIYPVATRAPYFPTAYLTTHHSFPTMRHRSPKPWANTYLVSLVSVRYGDKIQEALSLPPADFVTSSWERPQTVGEWLLSLWTSPAGPMWLCIGLSITNNRQGQEEQRYCQACRLRRKMPCFVHMMARRTQGCASMLSADKSVHGNMLHMWVYHKF